MSFLQYFVAIVAFTGLVTASSVTVNEVKTLEKRTGAACRVGSEVYHHDEMFTLKSTPCVVFRCQNGGYHITEQACESFGRCWPTENHFNFKCRTYKCKVTHMNGGGRQYNVVPEGQQLCEDSNGACHVAGTSFPYSIGGQVHQHCTCVISGAETKYTCS